MGQARMGPVRELTGLALARTNPMVPMVARTNPAWDQAGLAIWGWMTTLQFPFISIFGDDHFLCCLYQGLQRVRMNTPAYEISCSTIAHIISEVIEELNRNDKNTSHEINGSLIQ